MPLMSMPKPRPRNPCRGIRAAPDSDADRADTEAARPAETMFLKMRDDEADEEKYGAANEYPGHHASAGGTADRRELAGGDRRAVERA